MIQHLGQGFREELFATGLVMLVAVVGSYYLINLKLSQPEKAPMVVLDERVLGTSENSTKQTTQESPNNQAIMLDVESETAPQATPTPIPSPTPTTSATPKPNTVEIAYGENKEYDNEMYKISFSNARLIVGASRVFKVDVVIANKAVESEEGLHNRLHAKIERDGEVIIQQAAMSNTEIKQIHKGQQLTFTASISLISETDITEVVYNPGAGLASITYYTGPQF